MKKTSIITAAVLAASFGLVGCGGGGGGSGSGSASTTTVQGTAVDPELVGATVCVESSTGGCAGVGVQTDENGTYSISLNDSDLQTGVTLLVKGGYDRVTKMPFVGTMRTMVIESTATAQQMITPLTTLVYERAVELQGDVEQAERDVAALLGLGVDELRANMMQLAEDGEAEALQAALAMQQAAELAADTNDTRAFYRAMATGMMPQEGQSADFVDQGEAQSDLAALMTAVADSNLSGAEQLRVKYFAQAMDEMGAVSDPELYAMGVEKMQETVSDMNISRFTGELDTGFTLVSDFVASMTVTTPDDVEMYVTEHLLQAAGIAQPVIDQVIQTIVDNAVITVDTSFEMMITVIGQLKDDGDITQDQYDAMIVKLEAMHTEFEAA